jgi:hypothetical protein
MFSGLGTLISSCDIQQYTVDDQPMISFQARKTGKKSNFSAVTLQALCQSYNIMNIIQFVVTLFKVLLTDRQ